MTAEYCRKLNRDLLANEARHWWRCYLPSGHEGPCGRGVPEDVAGSDAEARGTYECPHCGFDRPHTHDADLLRWFEEATRNPRYDVFSQRKQARREAEAEYDRNCRKSEFDADPLAYRNKYGTINTTAGADGVQWAFERIVSLEARLSAMAVESIALAAKLRLVGMGADAALAAIDAHPAVEVVAQTPQPLRPREG